MTLNTNYLKRGIRTLEMSLDALGSTNPEDDIYELYRNSCVKGFELTLELSGKLLRKALKLFNGDPKSIDTLTFRDVFRHANKHGIVDEPSVARWFVYRDNRNNTAHDYGIGFANMTLALMPAFVVDAKALEIKLEDIFGKA